MPQLGHFSCVFLSISLAILFFVGIVVLKKQEAQHDNDKQATRVLWCAGGTLWQSRPPKRNLGRGADQPLAGEWEYSGGKFEDGEDGPGTLSYGVAMLRVAMLNKLKMAKWWAYHTGTTPRPITVDKRMLYRSAIKNEMRHGRIRKLVEGALACAQDDVWQTPEMWLKSDLTGLDELELMWGQIQQELKTKGAAYGND